MFITDCFLGYCLSNSAPDLQFTYFSGSLGESEYSIIGPIETEIGTELSNIEALNVHKFTPFITIPLSNLMTSCDWFSR